MADNLEALKRKAQEARLRAATSTHDDVRRTMIAVAEDYERVIKSEEEKRARAKNPD